jgi:Activator of Hsp90 ATPase homolog 1-like protein
MRGHPCSSTIGSMFTHPSIHLELARQRHQDLVAAAGRRRIANASDDDEAAVGLRPGRSSESRPRASGLRSLALTWRALGWPEDASTDSEVTFEPAEEGRLVRLEHSGFERLPDAERYLARYDGGWKTVLGWFAERVNAARG